MKFPDLTKICTPAQLYLFIELLVLSIMLFQNRHADNALCLGNYECYEAPNKGIMIFVKLGYVIFWTFVLNLICKAGYKSLSWFLVLLPIILFFIIIFLLGPWNYIYSDLLIENMDNVSSSNVSDVSDSDTSNMSVTPKLENAKEGAVYVKNKIDKAIKTKISVYQRLKKKAKENEDDTELKMYSMLLNDAISIKKIADNAVRNIRN